MLKTINIYSLLIYLIFINALGFVMMGLDKYYAIKKMWRIPESILLTVALIGGALGSFIGMELFRHKTKHLKFSVGLPILLVIQIIILNKIL